MRKKKTKRAMAWAAYLKAHRLAKYWSAKEIDIYADWLQLSGKSGIPLSQREWGRIYKLCNP